MTAEPEFVVDTDVVSRIVRRDLPGGLWARLEDASLLVTFITVGELLRGSVHAGWGARRLSALSAWLDRDVIVGDTAVARTWGAITGQALKAGRPLPVNDAWIAACCVTHGLPLATLNRRDYHSVEGLRLLTPG